MASRLFDLQETKGIFQVKGVVSGISKDKFYTSKKTKTGKDFRAVNFGCAYDNRKSVYMNLNGMPQQNVCFSKRNPDTGKTDIKKIPWADRNKFHEKDFSMIGVKLGLVKTTDNSGKTVNDKKTMHAFDACEYIKENLSDNESVFIRGNLDFSSYMDNQNNIHRSIKYVPNQISLCQEVDFSQYDNEKNKPVHNFTQTIVFTGIEKEKENDRDTGRFIVSAKIVTWTDIVDTQFIIVDAKLAGLFKKNLKPFNAIEVSGKIEVSHSIKEVSEEDCWGEQNVMKSVSAPTKTEMIITGANPQSIDRETYTEKNISDAIKKIRASQTAEQNFSGKTNVDISVDDDDNWNTDSGMDEDEDDLW